jgi:hypothetical protein
LSAIINRCDEEVTDPTSGLVDRSSEKEVIADKERSKIIEVSLSFSLLSLFFKSTDFLILY